MPRFCHLCGASPNINEEISLHQASKENQVSWAKYFNKRIPVNCWICSKHFPFQCLMKFKNRKYLNSQRFAVVVQENHTSNPDIPNSNSSKLSSINEETFLRTPGFPFHNNPVIPKQNRSESFKVNLTGETTSSESFLNETQSNEPPLPKILNFRQFGQFPQTLTLFNSIKNNINIVLLPPEWYMHKYEKHIVFLKLNTAALPGTKIEKSLTLDFTMKIAIFLNGVRKPLKNRNVISSVEELEKIINTLEKTNIFNRTRKNNKILNYKRKFTNLKKKHTNLHNVIANLRKEVVNENKLSSFQETLPDSQKELLSACIQATKREKHGVRYTLNWVYTCILMRIKSPRLYEHIRKDNIMPLPSHRTLLRYIKNIDGSFGFKKELFSVIKEKTSVMAPYERHGTILVDECKITESKHFKKDTMELCGFVDLGKHTPEKQNNLLGDHILVFMFQPFAGRGIQALGCFLSRGNVTGEVQANLMLECVLLCENAGLSIDLVCSDGATWNRSMWKHFGITDSLLPWCEHPFKLDSENRSSSEKKTLRFCSDWPHLVKCLRNLLIERKQFVVPEGIVKHSHFVQLLKCEDKNKFKIAYKLTKKHVWPQYTEKMSAKLAFQLFSNSVAIALNYYKDIIPELHDAEATIQFCLRINKIVDIMNSSSSFTGLQCNSDSYKELENFLLYLDLWEQVSPPKLFLSRSTANGLRATVRCALNLVDYLTNQWGFKYLMTKRMNQDALEHFFGLIRTSGGCNTHPESIQVGQIFRLMSIYSLVKPPRGSNVSGGEILKTLLHLEDIKTVKQKVNITFNLLVDDNIVLQNETFTDNREAFAYICGYIVRAFQQFHCLQCKNTLFGNGNEYFNSVITEKSRGFLTYPSQQLYYFLLDVEILITDIFKNELEKNALSVIIESIDNHKFKYLLGCHIHQSEVTQDILRKYVITRLNIACKKEANKRSIQNKSKKLAKLARLQ